jgi:hypothetical protein
VRTITLPFMRSTAQHSTAQYSTAQHSTAQHRQSGCDGVEGRGTHSRTILDNRSVAALPRSVGWSAGHPIAIHHNDRIRTQQQPITTRRQSDHARSKSVTGRGTRNCEPPVTHVADHDMQRRLWVDLHHLLASPLAIWHQLHQRPSRAIFRLL